MPERITKKVLIVEPTRFGLFLEGDFPHFFESTDDFPVKSQKRGSGEFYFLTKQNKKMIRTGSENGIPNDSVRVTITRPRIYGCLPT